MPLGSKMRDAWNLARSMELGVSFLFPGPSSGLMTALR